MIQFNQKDCLKCYIDIWKLKERQKAKSKNWNNFLKLINNAVCGKTMENVRKYGDTKLVTTERRRNYLVSKLNYHTTNFFTENSLEIEMKKTQLLITKPDLFRVIDVRSK